MIIIFLSKLYNANINYLSFSLSVRKENEAIKSIVFKRIPLKISTKKLFAQYEGGKSNHFSNFSKSPATADCPIEIDNDDNLSCSIQEMKSQHAPKADSPKKNKFRNLYDSSMSQSSGQELSYQNVSPKYCVFEEIPTPSPKKELKPEEHQSRSNDIVLSTSTEKSIKNATVSDQIVVPKRSCLITTHQSLSSLHNQTSITTIPSAPITHKFKLETVQSQQYVIKEQIESCFKINDQPLYYQKENESISQATERIFKNGMIFESKQKLKDLIHSFADFWFFCIAIDGCKYTCNRAGTYNNRRLQGKYAQRQHKRNFKCDCKWKIGFRFQNVANKNGPVILTSICPYHTFPCEPSQNQYNLARKVSGQLAK